MVDLKHRAKAMARLTLVPTMADLTLSTEQLAILHLYDIIADLGGRLSDAEARVAEVVPDVVPVFTSRRVAPKVVDFTSRRRVA
jgi:hypothetical protein